MEDVVDSFSIVRAGFDKFLESYSRGGEVRMVEPSEKWAANDLRACLANRLTELARRSGMQDAPLCHVWKTTVVESLAGTTVFLLAGIRNLHGQYLLPSFGTGGFEVLYQGCGLFAVCSGKGENALRIKPLLCPQAWGICVEHMRETLSPEWHGNKPHSWYGFQVAGMVQTLCKREGIDPTLAELVDGNIDSGRISLTYYTSPDEGQGITVKIEGQYIEPSCYAKFDAVVVSHSS